MLANSWILCRRRTGAPDLDPLVRQATRSIYLESSAFEILYITVLRWLSTFGITVFACLYRLSMHVDLCQYCNCSWSQLQLITKPALGLTNNLHQCQVRRESRWKSIVRCIIWYSIFCSDLRVSLIFFMCLKIPLMLAANYHMWPDLPHTGRTVCCHLSALVLLILYISVYNTFIKSTPQNVSL